VDLQGLLPKGYGENKAIRGREEIRKMHLPNLALGLSFFRVCSFLYYQILEIIVPLDIL